MISNMSSLHLNNDKSGISRPIIRHLVAAPIFFGIVLSYGQVLAGEPVSVVYRLYKDYGWVGMFALPEDAERHVGPPLTSQPRRILLRYFNESLARLLVKEEMCLKKSKGSVCNLEFDPLFASQDPSAVSLEIRQTEPNTVCVNYTTPSSGDEITINYILELHGASWRIKDIIYSNMNNLSLKRILSK